MGELMINTAKYMGINGLLIDGYVRDAELVEQMDYPVFCKGFIPRQPGKADQGEINGRVNCAGIVINPGDVVMGDADGVVVIPRADLAAVLDAAEAKDELDNSRREQIETFFCDNIGNRQGKDIKQIMSKDVRELLNKI